MKKIDCQACKGPTCRFASPTQWVTLDGVRFNDCPWKLVTPLTKMMMEFYQHYKNHILPVAGGLLDQSNKYLKAMGVIDSAVNAAQKEAGKNNG